TDFCRIHFDLCPRRSSRRSIAGASRHRLNGKFLPSRTEQASATRSCLNLEPTMFRPILFGATGAVLFACTAAAHVTLETREAPVGASYKAVLRVPHGCEGTATT